MSRKVGGASQGRPSRLLLHLCFSSCLNYLCTIRFSSSPSRQFRALENGVPENTGSLQRPQQTRAGSPLPPHVVRAPVCPHGEPPTNSDGVSSPSVWALLPLSEPGRATLSQNLSQTPRSFTAPLGLWSQHRYTISLSVKGKLNSQRDIRRILRGYVSVFCVNPQLLSDEGGHWNTGKFHEGQE